MKNFAVKASEESPSICLKEQNTVLCLSGRSNSPNVQATFNQLFSWLDELGNEKSPVTLRFEFKLEYYNSLTASLLLDFLLKLDKLSEKDHSVSVAWYYEKFDADMKESGEAYAAMVSIPFSFIEK